MSKISVCVLSYNQGDFIRQCLASIEAQSQSGMDIEILLCDDGSDDRTVEEINSFFRGSTIANKLFLKKHRGIAAIAENLNHLVSESSGDYLAFIAGDDFYLKDRFVRQLEILETNPSKDVVYSLGVNRRAEEVVGLCINNQTFSAVYSERPDVLLQHVTEAVPLLFVQGVLARASLFRDFEPFDESLVADDWVFNIRACQRMLERGTSFSFLPEIVFGRNLHDSNTSRNVMQHTHRVLQVASEYSPSESFVNFKRKLRNQAIKKLLRNPAEAPEFFSVLKLLRAFK